MAELPTDQSLEICSIETSGLDLIDELLRTNRTSPMLQEYRDKVKDHTSPWTLEDNGLLKNQERLVVAEDNDLQTKLITEAHAQVTTAHPGKNKTRKIIVGHYYWPGMTADIDCYV